MKLIFILLFLLTSLLFSSSVFSEESANDSNQWSVTLFSGSNSLDLDESNVSETVFSSGFEVGYQLDKQFGLKAGLQAGLDFGFVLFPLSVLGVEVDSYTFASQYFAATARTKEDLHVFGAIGLARIEERFNTFNSDVSLEKSSTSLYWEVGIGWDFNDYFGIGLSYTDTSAEFADVSATHFKIKFEF